ncbi:hypothetical protein XELAEV_18046683mg [Xenopus laevis]|uniref:Protein kinase domain-containing protein n=1 Tax=Xenopus laevis TaxID=8355 RepID=A0A974H0V9_XENLA|nr:hypothetical protein XELAEV_18046683mg [Xenopus laevis]
MKLTQPYTISEVTPTEDDSRPGCSSNNVPSRLSLERFSFLKELGIGGFAKVLLAKDCTTQGLVALKIVKKRRMLNNAKDTDSFMVERRVLQEAKNYPFLTCAYGAFQTPKLLCFVMEYLPGGDLANFLDRFAPLDERDIQFFAAEIVLGLKILHRKGIVHRDLKPQNILMDSQGHLKIADFGLALEGMFEGKTATGYAGTEGYIAPEMLQNEPYNASVDWFAFGVILYEMATGDFPFHGDSSGALETSVLEDIPKIPSYVSWNTEALIDKLLCKDPHYRLGLDKEIFRQPLFQDTDWDAVVAHAVPPPFPPEPVEDQKPKGRTRKSCSRIRSSISGRLTSCMMLSTLMSFLVLLNIRPGTTKVPGMSFHLDLGERKSLKLPIDEKLRSYESSIRPIFVSCIECPDICHAMPIGHSIDQTAPLPHLPMPHTLLIMVTSVPEQPEQVFMAVLANMLHNKAHRYSQNNSQFGVHGVAAVLVERLLLNNTVTLPMGPAHVRCAFMRARQVLLQVYAQSDPSR